MEVRNRFIRFLLAGGLNTLFGLGVYSLAVYMGWPVWAALLVANLAGLAFNFLTTGGYAFRSLLLSHFWRFAAAYAGLFLLNWALIGVLAHWVTGPIVAQVILTLPLAVLSYFVMAKLVFIPPRRAASNQEGNAPF